jgi:hypothetical protein
VKETADSGGSGRGKPKQEERGRNVFIFIEHTFVAPIAVQPSAAAIR